VEAGNVRDYHQMTEADLNKGNTMTTAFNPKEYESTRAAAVRTAHSQSWVYGELKAGRIRGVNIGGRWYVRSADIDALLANAPESGEAAE
jgi:hypothetical protein